MKALKLASCIFAFALLTPWAGTALAKGHGQGKGKGNASTGRTVTCPAGASTATFQDKNGTGTAAFKNAGACRSFFAHNRSATNVTITASQTFRPGAALPAGTTAATIRGNSLAARSVCPTTHNFTVGFTNNSITVNNQAVTVSGKTVTVNQLSQSAATILSGSHTFANHGGCVSFFSQNKNLFVLSLT